MITNQRHLSLSVSVSAAARLKTNCFRVFVTDVRPSVLAIYLSRSSSTKNRPR